MNPTNESARILLANLRTYIEMYREWGLEGVTIKSGGRCGDEETRSSHAPRTPALAPAEPDARLNTKAGALAVLRNEIGDCTRCKLHTGRTQIVFGTGNPEAELMFVGEAPGEDEDLQGQPFVGKAGQLLTRIIEAMGLKRKDVYIANIIKCRPPRNRNPEPDEIASCSPFLQRQIEIIRPKVICALGNFAAQTLLGTGQKISQLRGRFHDLPMSLAGHAGDRIKVMPTFHPAYLLRNPQDKKQVWEDMQQIMHEIGR